MLSKNNIITFCSLEDWYCIAVSGGADLVLYAAMNFAGLYAKYLTDRAGRKAFLETRRSHEMRCKAEKENDKQEKLLLSGTLFVSSISLLNVKMNEGNHIQMEQSTSITTLCCHGDDSGFRCRRRHREEWW